MDSSLDMMLLHRTVFPLFVAPVTVISEYPSEIADFSFFSRLSADLETYVTVGCPPATILWKP